MTSIHSTGACCTCSPAARPRPRYFSPGSAHQTLELREASKLAQFGDFVVTGIWHIWKGIDHILFFCCRCCCRPCSSSATKSGTASGVRPTASRRHSSTS
ncbi:hypothetical protein ACFS07_23590 [Undibacterium arcticum]